MYLITWKGLAEKNSRGLMKPLPGREPIEPLLGCCNALEPRSRDSDSTILAKASPNFSTAS
jgi:hypothetical protein